MKFHAKTHDISINFTRKFKLNLHDLSCDSHEKTYGYENTIFTEKADKNFELATTEFGITFLSQSIHVRAKNCTLKTLKILLDRKEL